MTLLQSIIAFLATGLTSEQRKRKAEGRCIECGDRHSDDEALDCYLVSRMGW